MSETIKEQEPMTEEEFVAAVKADEKEQQQRQAGHGALRSFRSGIKKVAGSEEGPVKPPSAFDKITDILFYVAMVAFIIWFLWKKFSMMF